MNDDFKIQNECSDSLCQKFVEQLVILMQANQQIYVSRSEDALNAEHLKNGKMSKHLDRDQSQQKNILKINI